MNKRIFVSYSRANTGFVSGLINNLIAQGLSVWMDQRDIAAGQRWDSIIQQALQTCDVFIIVLSPESTASENVLDELSYAINEGKRIIPVLYRDCEIPYRIARVQFVDFRQDYQTAFRHLVSEVTQQAPQRPVTVKKPGSSRRVLPWVLGLALLFLLCAGLGIGGMLAYPYLFPTEVPVTEKPDIPTDTPKPLVPPVTEKPFIPPPVTEAAVTEPTPEPPHAPPIENTYGVQLFDEHQQLITIASGEQHKLAIMELWSGPVGSEPSCADGFMALTWTVRSPYPAGGQDLQLLRLIPMGEGRTEVFASGSQGSTTVGYCEEIFLFNASLQEYKVEIRYASGKN